MEKFYNHQVVEEKIRKIWEKADYFTPKIDFHKKPFSIFLTPPNASGPMHVGNALSIAIQDILARYYRGKGTDTLWIPSTDHGGYETEVMFERNLDEEGKDRFAYRRKDLFKKVEKFVEKNNDLIKNQIKALGASVDWSRFRFTMDERAINSVHATFRKMVEDGIIYRAPYMVYYCPVCKTVLADIELQKKEEQQPLYFIKFPFLNEEGYLFLATTRPEFIFSSTHLLIEKEDQQHANLIGRKIINPSTNKIVEIVESKRKFDPENIKPFLFPFSPSYNKYDYEYAIRHDISSKNLLDWEGKMIERYPGLTPAEARDEEIKYFKNNNYFEKVDNSYQDMNFYCKRGHKVESLIIFTWFLKLDDKKNNLRKNALDGIKNEGLNVFPFWKKKGLVEWLEKMTDWPIARQNVWGIKIPVWYDISEPSKFLVWFTDRKGKRQQGNLKLFLDNGTTLEEISDNLEKIYTSETNLWILQKERGKTYLPETDTFDTWFSSGQWASIVFGENNSSEFTYFYPSHSIVIGRDLLRLSVSRKILLSSYLSGKLPFKNVYLHHLIKGEDGQKMSKSLGNVKSLDYYLEKFGADVTRMALISYTSLQEDFVFEEERLFTYKEFSDKLWKMGRIAENINQFLGNSSNSIKSLVNNSNIDLLINKLSEVVNSEIERFAFTSAQDKLCKFLPDLENYAHSMKTKDDFYIFLVILQKYFKLLHPFMPFLTEELSSSS